MPPVNEKYVLSFLRFVIVGDVSTVERDDVSALEFHFFDETTPSFSHHVALATAPIRFSACCFGITSRFSFPTSLGVSTLSNMCSPTAELKLLLPEPLAPVSVGSWTGVVLVVDIFIKTII
ncbi:hypothetical protein YC2023_035539 [Brassica napus]